MIKPDVKQAREILPHRLFDDSPDAWNIIAPNLRHKSYHKDEVVIHHGDSAGNLWLVYRGWVKLTRLTPDGKETIISLCSEDDMFGEAALFMRANYPYNAQIISSDADLAMIPAEVIRRLIAKDASLSAHIMSMFSRRTAQAQLKLEHMSTMSAAQRLGCFLLRLCQNQAERAKTLQIPVDKNILASYLGMKPETLSRSQQQLKVLGVVLKGHTIIIDNISRLRDFVCNSCSESGLCEADASVY